MSPLLRVRDLVVAYRGVPAVDGVSFDVAPGEFVAVVGESGSGKSTTVASVLGLLPGAGRVASGSVHFEGADITRYDERAFRRIRGARIGFVPQDPAVSLNPVQRVGVQVGEGLRAVERLPRERVRARVLDVLARVGIDRPELRAEQYPHELSGGMRQRVLVALASIREPALVIADEPTSALDVTVQRRVLDLLDDLRARGTAVLLVTHDLAVALERADRVLVMRHGRIVEHGPAGEILRHPHHDYTRHLLAVAPSVAAPPTRRAPAGGEPAVRVTDLRRTFRLGAETVTAVDGVSFDIPRGGTFGLVGSSGSGKSTVARIVSRLERADSGSVTVDDLEVVGMTRTQARTLWRRLQLVHQNPYTSLDPRLSIGDIVSEPLRNFRIGDRASRTAAAGRLLDQVRLSAADAARRPAELSGGQRQRVAIARALALEPPVLVLDEPVSALDVSVQADILDLLDDLQRERGLSYLFISHDLAVVRGIADRVGVMHAGRLVEQGTAEQVFTDPQDPYTRELLDAVPGRA